MSACLFLLILFTQPTLVGSASTYKLDTSHCNGKGNINSLTGLCDCFSGYRGADCSLRYCPYGSSWLSAPKYQHERNRERVECSNMGTCDIFSGKCTCRPGYEGRACERSECLLQNNMWLIFIVESCPSSTNSACSGHGKCMTMREAGLDFDGLYVLITHITCRYKYFLIRALINPPIDYNGWDADAIMGCVCDRGYEGYDCSSRSCPWGRDPTASGPIQEEKFVMRCQADNGYFSITLLGKCIYCVSVQWLILFALVLWHFVFVFVQDAPHQPFLIMPHPLCSNLCYSKFTVLGACE